MSDHLADLQRDFNHARDALYTAVIAACPGLHHSVQHRDRRPPWCHACGRDDLGRHQTDRTPPPRNEPQGNDLERLAELSTSEGDAAGESVTPSAEDDDDGPCRCGCRCGTCECGGPLHCDDA